MSRDVSRADKTVRIILFSLYLAAIVLIVSLVFGDIKFSFTLFVASLGYFITIFTILALTNNVHFNVLLKRKALKKSKILCRAKFHLAKLMHFKIIFILSAVFLLITTIYYLIVQSFALAIIVFILLFFTYLYFYVHKIRLFAIKEGLVFDYGEFVVLLQWKEMKNYKRKDSHFVVHLKESNIRRGFYVDNAAEFEKVMKRMIKQI